MSHHLFWLSLTGKIPCMFQKLTGLYCPGCGGTRAVKALLRGNILVSALYHPFVIYCAAVGLVFAVSYVIYWKTKKPAFRLYLENGFLYAGLAILAINFVVKNYFLIVKGIDLLAFLPNIS